MRDYEIARRDAPTWRRVADLPTAEIIDAIHDIAAGHYTRVHPSSPAPEDMLERLRIELVARSLSP